MTVPIGADTSSKELTVHGWTETVNSILLVIDLTSPVISGYEKLPSMATS